MVTSQISIPQESLFLIRTVHYLLLKGIESGLSLRDIAEMIARTDYGLPSPLEKAIADGEEIAYRAMEARNSFHHSTTSFNDVSSPRLLAQSPLVNNIPKAVPMTRKDTNLTCLQGQSRLDLRLDDIDVASSVVHPSIATFSSFQSNDSAFVTRTVSEISSSPNSMGPADYFMQDLEDPSSPLKTICQQPDLHHFAEIDAYPFKKHNEITDTTKTQLQKDVPAFTSLEVPTTELINFDKPKVSNRDRAFSCYTSEEENDSGGESLACSPSDGSMLDYVKSTLQGMPLASFPRVVSFGAFESPSLYDVDDKADRHFLRLRKERRKQMAKSEEFRCLKLKFAYEGLDKILHYRSRLVRDRLSKSR